MADLSENDIKKAGLALLQQHYRFRPRGGAATLRYDLRGEGGIVVDAALSFPREGEVEPPFLATLEATSYQTRDEVRYRVQTRRLGWDATAVGALVATLVFTVQHARGFEPLNAWGPTNTALFGFALLLVGHLVYRVAFAHWKRYRFIYAVEQFKQYFADEQWIAVGEDVFEEREGRYFTELRSQCIYQGLGLIVVDVERRAHLHITPSRADLFGGRRRRLEFQSLADFSRRLPMALSGGEAPKRIGSAAHRPRRRRSWMRDPFRYFYQATVVLVAFTLIATLMFLEWRNRPVLVVDEEAYDARLLERRQGLEGVSEPPDFLLDTPAAVPFRRRVDPYLRLEPLTESDPGPVRQPPGLIALDERGRVGEYPCARVRNPDQTRYAIELTGLDRGGPLVDLLRRLRGQGYRAAGLWLGCFSDTSTGYVVVLTPFYTTRQRAQRELARVRRTLGTGGVATDLRLMELQ